jgi:hypothetical protein
MDITFGNCLLVSGFCYILILVDQATRNDWMFVLKTLSSDSILATIRLFCSLAGSLMNCFYSDSNAKLFGTAIAEYLINNGSKPVAAPANQQSCNGLVESNQKTMVHMARAYLTENKCFTAFGSTPSPKLHI